ncbi:hypothetical protein D9M72_570730 [compost metagenome]
MVHDHAVLSVHGCLYVVPDPRPFVRSQHSRIAFVGIELLKLHRFHQRLARQVIGMPDFKLRQSRPDRTAVNLFAGFGFICLVQLGQIVGDALLQLLLLMLEPLQIRMTP